MDDIKEFKKIRNEALLSMNKEKFTVYAKKYCGVTIDDKNFLLVIHKARTGCTDLPMNERLISKRWLTAHKYHSLDDGELTTYKDSQ